MQARKSAYGSGKTTSVRFLAACCRVIVAGYDIGEQPPAPDGLPGGRPRRLTTDNNAKASFAQFAGSPGYEAADLCTDIERFSFLLGGNDGEHLLA